MSIIDKMDKIRQKRFPNESINMKELNQLTVFVLVLEAKGLLTEKEMDELQEYFS